jgi:hypothetical protein
LADPRLNHNLLTVTDPKGQTFLSNTYAPTLNPQDFAFDRVLTQRLGLANEQLSFSICRKSRRPPTTSRPPSVL